MADWQQRLSRVHAQMPAAEEESVNHLTLEQLKATPMSFGKAHVGKSFETIWKDHPDWIKWFFNHYKTSPKTEHKKMIRFIQLRIEEEESQDPPASAALQASAKPKSMPKSYAAKAKCQPAPASPWQIAEGSETEELMMEPPWVTTEMIEVQEEVQVIHSRLQGLENAMQQVIALISGQERNSNANQGLAHPETAVIDLHDPWEQ
jgi:hypothetical protein